MASNLLGNGALKVYFYQLNTTGLTLIITLAKKRQQIRLNMKTMNYSVMPATFANQKATVVL